MMKNKVKPHQQKSVVNQVATLTKERKEIFAAARNRYIPVKVASHNIRVLDAERAALLA